MRTKDFWFFSRKEHLYDKAGGDQIRPRRSERVAPVPPRDLAPDKKMRNEMSVFFEAVPTCFK